MRGARNCFCVVVLADHRRLAPQRTGHRRLAWLECINHVHLQRRGRGPDEEKRERRNRRRGRTEDRKTPRCRKQSVVIADIRYWKTDNENPITIKFEAAEEEEGWKATFKSIELFLFVGESFSVILERRKGWRLPLKRKKKGNQDHKGVTKNWF